jgi:hypothetical protein
MITEAIVMHSETAHIGDRVKHFGQRYGNGEGTAEVTGFREEDGNIIVLVKPDNPNNGFPLPGWMGRRQDRVDRLNR